MKIIKKMIYSILFFFMVLFGEMVKSPLKTFISLVSPAFIFTPLLFIDLSFLEGTNITPSIFLSSFLIFLYGIVLLYYIYKSRMSFLLFESEKTLKVKVKEFKSIRRSNKRGYYYTHYMIYNLNMNNISREFQNTFLLKEEYKNTEDSKLKEEIATDFLRFHKNGMTDEDFDKYARKDFEVICDSKIKNHVIKNGYLNTVYEKIKNL